MVMELSLIEAFKCRDLSNIPLNIDEVLGVIQNISVNFWVLSYIKKLKALLSSGNIVQCYGTKLNCTFSIFIDLSIICLRWGLRRYSKYIGQHLNSN